MFVDAKVPAGTAWGVDAATVITVLREDVELAVSEDVELAVSEDAYFSSDRIAIRATCRIGFGFPKPIAVVRLDLAGEV